MITKHHLLNICVRYQTCKSTKILFRDSTDQFNTLLQFEFICIHISLIAFWKGRLEIAFAVSLSFSTVTIKIVLSLIRCIAYIFNIKSLPSCFTSQRLNLSKNFWGDFHNTVVKKICTQTRNMKYISKEYTKNISGLYFKPVYRIRICENYIHTVIIRCVFTFKHKFFA